MSKKVNPRSFASIRAQVKNIRSRGELMRMVQNEFFAPKWERRQQEKQPPQEQQTQKEQNTGAKKQNPSSPKTQTKTNQPKTPQKKKQQ